MTKILTFKGLDIVFPYFCMVCQQPAEKQYTVSKTFFYGKRSITINQTIPLCSQHHAIANTKSSTEIIVERLGVIIGILTGMEVTGGLLWYWTRTEEGNIFINIFLASVVGIGFFLISWTAISLLLSPVFAGADSKLVRESLKIRRYWPGSGEVQLEFANESCADMVANANFTKLVD